MQDQPDDRLLHALNDPAELVRSAAAIELARREHPQALQACLDTIDDAAELTHTESTPSVWCLVGMGARAVEPLLERMAGAEGDATRLRAAHALMHISKRRFGFDGNRWADGTYPTWAQWWSGMGYEHRADTGARALAVQRLREAMKVLK